MNNSEKRLDNTVIANIIKEDVKNKEFSCIYVFIGKHKSGFVRFFVNDRGKDDIDKWTSSDEIERNDDTVSAYWALFKSLCPDSFDKYKYKFIKAGRFPKFLWKSFRPSDEFNQEGCPIVSVDLLFYGVFLVYNDPSITFKEIEIKSIHQFIKYYVERDCSLKKESYNLYYRGQLAHWNLKPSLFREKAWVEKESKMNAQIICDRPKDFLDCRTTFEKLVKLKHFNQPSRLLDLTSNPLVGLFFACDCMTDDKTKSGIGIITEVYSKKDKEKLSETSDTVIMLSALSNAKRFDDICSVPKRCKFAIDGYSLIGEVSGNKCSQCKIEKKDRYNKKRVVITQKDKYINEIIHQCKMESGKELYWDDLCYGELNQCVLVIPSLNNNRIVQQQGCFIMCGLNPVSFNEPPKSYRQFFAKPRLENDSDSKWIHYYVLPDKLEEICKALSILGINKYFIYPDLDKDIDVKKWAILQD